MDEHDALPITAVLPKILGALRREHHVIIAAPTGSGKTTQVPQAIFDTGLAGDGMILVVQPRRIACRAAATYIARQRGVPLGGEVGYCVRFDNCSSPATRLCFITDGILIRALERAPHLPEASVVIFDEFHERRAQMDIALAVLHEERQRRTNLRLVVMSAVLPTEQLAAYLHATVVRAEGRQFPVTITHREALPLPRDLPGEVAGAIIECIAAGRTGDILAFLPGKGEIDAVRRLLEQQSPIHRAAIFPLHGDLQPSEQDGVFTPLPQRKIILATNVAETSLTIPGVTVVVDGGYERVASYDTAIGADILATERITETSAVQRAGRAGRTAPGTCIRCWPTRTQLRPTLPPEIQRMDLGSTVLTLAAIGIRAIEAFPFPDPPRVERIAAARDLLATLGALDAAGELTTIGRHMLRYPLSPRFARMVVAAERRQCRDAVATIAALLSWRPVARTMEKVRAVRRDFAAEDGSDCFTLLAAFDAARDHGFDPQWCAAHGLQPEVLIEADIVRRHILRERSDLPPRDAANRDAVRRCIAAGLLDRVAQRRENGTYLLTNGAVGVLDRASVVRDAPLIVAASVRALAAPSRTGATVRLAHVTAIERDWLQTIAKRAQALGRVRIEVIASADGHTVEVDGACLPVHATFPGPHWATITRGPQGPHVELHGRIVEIPEQRTDRAEIIKRLQSFAPVIARLREID